MLSVIKIYIVIVSFIASAMVSLLIDRKLNWFKLFSVALLLIFAHLFLSCNGDSALHDTYIFFVIHIYTYIKAPEYFKPAN